MFNIFKHLKTKSKLKRQLNDANNCIFNLNNKILKQKKSHVKQQSKTDGRISEQRKMINSLNKKVRRTQKREKQLIDEKEKLKDRIFGKKPKNKIIPFKLTSNMLLRGVW